MRFAVLSVLFYNAYLDRWISYQETLYFSISPRFLTRMDSSYYQEMNNGNTRNQREQTFGNQMPSYDVDSQDVPF